MTASVSITLHPTSIKISGATSEHFEIKVGLRQGCVMSSWLFNIYMYGVMREIKGKVGELGVKMYTEGRKWVLNSTLIADDSALCRKWKWHTKSGKCF